MNHGDGIAFIIVNRAMMRAPLCPPASQNDSDDIWSILLNVKPCMMAAAP